MTDKASVAQREQLHGYALVESLQRRFRTAVVDVTVNDRKFRILKPANPDDLIREEDFVKDERLPYWADIWPSSTILAAKLLEMEGAGATALELGCGVGLCTMAARIAGFDVLSTDYYEDSLDFTRANAFTNLGTEARTRLFDWRHPPADVGRYDLAFASDVLYEQEYAQLLPSIFDRTLTPGGSALVADPGRVAAPLFVEACARTGLEAAKIETLPFESGEVRQSIDIYRITRCL